jgi:hypothetical protein
MEGFRQRIAVFDVFAEQEIGDCASLTTPAPTGAQPSDLTCCKSFQQWRKSSDGTRDLFFFFFNSWGNKAIQDERVTTFVCSKGVDKESSDKVRLFEYQK